MSEITVFQRHENKFLVEVKAMDRILAEIREHMDPDEYCVGGRSYAIANLYYDNDNNDVIRESLQKPFYKEKLRMRSYGIPQSGDTRVFLEMKKKVNGVVLKRRASLTYQEAQDFMQDRIFPENMSYMTEQVLREIEYYLSHKEVKANTRITYDRQGFFGREDRNFRVTFDKNIRYLKAENPGEEVDFHSRHPGRLILQEHLMLMEVKVIEAYPMWFSRLLKDEGIYPVSFSKFGVSYKFELIRNGHFQHKNVDILAHI